MSSIRRCLEALDLGLRHATDLATVWALLVCYAATMRDPYSQRKVRLRLRFGQSRFTVSMRATDIYTLAEILHEKQYPLPTDLDEAPVIVDAGANIGLTAFWFLAHRPQARLFCFEPEEENFRLLQQNLAPLQSVRLEQCALAVADGESELHLGAHPALPSLVPLEGATTTTTVRTRPLGPYLRDKSIERVDLLKLDVEGAELSVLQSLGRDIVRIERIVGELHLQHVDAPTFYSWLDGQGFEIEKRRVFASASGRGVESFEARRRESSNAAAQPLPVT